MLLAEPLDRKARVMSAITTTISSSPRTGTVLPVVRYQLQCGDRALRLRRFHLMERAGAPYRATIGVIGEDPEIEAADLVGADVCLSIQRGEVERTLSGMVHHVEHTGFLRSRPHLVLHVGPAVELLGHGRRSRIFQGMTVPEALEAVAGPLLQARHRELDLSRLTGRTFEPRDYCVQYQESDLDFFHRLLDEEGLTYCFDHGRAEHEVLVVLDGSKSAPDVSVWGGGSQVRLVTDRQEEADDESIMGLCRSHRPPGPRVIQRNWDWTADPAHAYEHAGPGREGAAELVEHQGRRLWSVDTSGLAARQQEALAVREDVLEGSGNVTGFSAGMVYELLDSDHDGRYFLVEVSHRGDAPEAELGPDEPRGAAPSYENRFVSIPVQVPFRSPPRVIKPMIHGPQTAVVVGPDDEEIFTDEHGRIKIRFHWDRSTTPSEDASCWLRVAQPWAGPGWGSTFIPRVGMEVVVCFLDGDPDRPLCMGCVFNGQNRSPLALPDERTRTSIRTRSSPGGDGYNELCFEDAAGAEQVLLRAQRDLQESVGHDHVRSVGHDERVSVGGNRSLAIEGRQQVSVMGKAADGAALAPPHYGIDVDGDYRLEAASTAEIVAEAAIRLRCGETLVELTPTTITLQAGSGAKLVLDVAALLGSHAGASLSLDDGGRLVAQSRAPATLVLDETAELRSVAGSRVELTSAVVAVAATPPGASAGARLRLTTDADLSAHRVCVASEAAALTMSTAAIVEAGSIELSGADVSCAATQGLSLSATKLDASGRGLVTIAAPLVKIN